MTAPEAALDEVTADIYTLIGYFFPISLLNKFEAMDFFAVTFNGCY